MNIKAMALPPKTQALRSLEACLSNQGIDKDHYEEPVKVFLARVTDWPMMSSDTLPELLAKRAARYRRPEDKQRSCLSYFLCHLCLSKSLNHKIGQAKSGSIQPAPEQIEYSLNDWQRPHCNHGDFNISHSDNLIAIALSRQPVGVHLEFGQHFFTGAGLEQFMTPIEKLSLNQCRSSEQYRNKSLKLWNQKQAFLKTIGSGLQFDWSEILNFKPIPRLHQPDQSHLNKTQQRRLNRMQECDKRIRLRGKRQFICRYLGAVEDNDKLAHISLCLESEEDFQFECHWLTPQGLGKSVELKQRT